jgi:hypothetical protein
MAIKRHPGQIAVSAWLPGMLGLDSGAARSPPSHLPQDEVASEDMRLSEEASMQKISSSTDDISDRDP